MWCLSVGTELLALVQSQQDVLILLLLLASRVNAHITYYSESDTFAGRTFALPALDNLVPFFSDFLSFTKYYLALVLQDLLR